MVGKTTVDNITDRRTIKETDKEVVEAIESWHEEERDMALIIK